MKNNRIYPAASIDIFFKRAHREGTIEGTIMPKLSALGVAKARPGRHCDGDGLYLYVKPTGAKSWVLRVQFKGTRRDIGLGSVAALSLAEARDRARELRRHALNGRDPVAERDREFNVAPDFKTASIDAHKSLSAGWAQRTADAFLSALQEHAWPVIGTKRVDQIEAAQIQDVLRPIWTTKPAMARKVRQFIGTVLNFSKSRGWRKLDPPGKSVTIGLPKRPRGGHFRAMPYRDVPAFVERAMAKGRSVSRLALLFQILTAARPGEVRKARWDQIDLGKGEWVRPPDIMKNGEQHVVALNAAARRLLSGLQQPKAPNALVFPGRNGRLLSDMSMGKVLKAEKLPFDAHGFRSAFRDWAAESMPHIPDPVAEAALSHIVADEVVRAYKRTKFTVLQRELLEAWGAFVDPPSTAQ